ncbi:hypothetical protein HOB10_01705 [Candidatus Parcubacteria bacterium]|jgi:hypothetical protein|nr:hypothetical protein [Candidatus Parcubacteria bacterium]
MEKIFESTPSPAYIEVFHTAQSKLAAGDIEEGKKFLQEAIDLAVLENKEKDFVWYMKGTQAYLDKDEEALQEAIVNVGESPNADILQRFLDKLQSNEELDYGQDYGQGEL